jgi:hypothetical protein
LKGDPGYGGFSSKAWGNSSWKIYQNNKGFVFFPFVYVISGGGFERFAFMPAYIATYDSPAVPQNLNLIVTTSGALIESKAKVLLRKKIGCLHRLMSAHSLK